MAPRVEQHEIARAVGVLRFAGLHAHLADGRRLLIAKIFTHSPAPRRQAGPLRRVDAVRRALGGRADGRQHLPRDVEHLQELVIPCQGSGGPSAWSGSRWAYSVTWAPPSRPPVRFRITQVSIFPNTASPRSAASRTPSTFRESAESSRRRNMSPAEGRSVRPGRPPHGRAR